jgi:hypothetical protein
MKRHRQSIKHYFPPPYPPPPPKKNPPPPELRPLEELELGGEELSFVLPNSRPAKVVRAYVPNAKMARPK